VTDNEGGTKNVLHVGVPGHPAIVTDEKLPSTEIEPEPSPTVEEAASSDLVPGQEISEVIAGETAEHQTEKPVVDINPEPVTTGDEKGESNDVTNDTPSANMIDAKNSEINPPETANGERAVEIADENPGIASTVPGALSEPAKPADEDAHAATKESSDVKDVSNSLEEQAVSANADEVDKAPGSGNVKDIFPETSLEQSDDINSKHDKTTVPVDIQQPAENGASAAILTDEVAIGGEKDTNSEPSALAVEDEKTISEPAMEPEATATEITPDSVEEPNGESQVPAAVTEGQKASEPSHEHATEVDMQQVDPREETTLPVQEEEIPAGDTFEPAAAGSSEHDAKIETLPEVEAAKGVYEERPVAETNESVAEPISTSAGTEIGTEAETIQSVESRQPVDDAVSEPLPTETEQGVEVPATEVGPKSEKETEEKATTEETAEEKPAVESVETSIPSVGPEEATGLTTIASQDQTTETKVEHLVSHEALPGEGAFIASDEPEESQAVEEVDPAVTKWVQAPVSEQQAEHEAEKSTVLTAQTLHPVEQSVADKPEVLPEDEAQVLSEDHVDQLVKEQGNQQFEREGPVESHEFSADKQTHEPVEQVEEETAEEQPTAEQIENHAPEQEEGEAATKPAQVAADGQHEPDVEATPEPDVFIQNDEDSKPIVDETTVPSSETLENPEEIPAADTENVPIETAETDETVNPTSQTITDAAENVSPEVSNQDAAAAQPEAAPIQSVGESFTETVTEDKSDTETQLKVSSTPSAEITSLAAGAAGLATVANIEQPSEPLQNVIEGDSTHEETGAEDDERHLKSTTETKEAVAESQPEPDNGTPEVLNEVVAAHDAPEDLEKVDKSNEAIAQEQSIVVTSDRDEPEPSIPVEVAEPVEAVGTHTNPEQKNVTQVDESDRAAAEGDEVSHLTEPASEQHEEPVRIETQENAPSSAQPTESEEIAQPMEVTEQAGAVQSEAVDSDPKLRAEPTIENEAVKSDDSVETMPTNVNQNVPLPVDRQTAEVTESEAPPQVIEDEESFPADEPEPKISEAPKEEESVVQPPEEISVPLVLASVNASSSVIAAEPVTDHASAEEIESAKALENVPSKENAGEAPTGEAHSTADRSSVEEAVPETAQLEATSEDLAAQEEYTSEKGVKEQENVEHATPSETLEVRSDDTGLDAPQELSTAEHNDNSPEDYPEDATVAAVGAAVGAASIATAVATQNHDITTSVEEPTVEKPTETAAMPVHGSLKEIENVVRPGEEPVEVSIPAPADSADQATTEHTEIEKEGPAAMVKADLQDSVPGPDENSTVKADLAKEPASDVAFADTIGESASKGEIPVSEPVENTPLAPQEADLEDLAAELSITREKLDEPSSEGALESGKAAPESEYVLSEVTAGDASETKLKDRLLSSDALHAAEAAGVVGAVAVVLESDSASSSEQGPKHEQHKSIAEEQPVALPAQTLTPEIDVQTESQNKETHVSRAPPTPEPEADLALQLLASDREALLNQLGGSTSVLNLLSDEQRHSTVDAQAAGSSKDATATGDKNESSKPIEGTSETAASKDTPEHNEDSRSNAERSTKSLSLKSENWLKALFRSIFATIFGRLFSSLRRSKSPK
jgi:hypothetical protein